MAESLIALILLWIVLGVAVELSLLFRTKAALNHAALQAARNAMVANAEPQALVNGLARGMLPLFGPEPGLAAAAQTLATDVLPELVQFSRIRVINPTRSAFDDFGQPVDGEREIPNDELHRRPGTAGAASGVSIQDANLLKIEVVYGVPLRIPIISPAILRSLLTLNALPTSSLDAFSVALLEAGRVPVVATATVRMQSPARLNNLMVR